MTMQVAMVGTDGIVLASDTQRTQLVGGMRSSFNTSKIRISHQRGIAISCARNMDTAGLVADSIIAGLDNSQMGSPVGSIEDIANNVIEEGKDQSNPRNDIQCIVVLLRPRPQLFRLRSISVTGRYVAKCDQEIVGKVVTGDIENAAVFWSERYYERRPISYLARLAAQVVVMGAKISSGMNGGLEVVLGDASGFRRLSADSNAYLESTAIELDETLRKLFVGDLASLTCTPNEADWKPASTNSFEISIEELKHRLDAKEDVFILDVREPNEYQICNLNGHLIPLNDLPKRVNELDPGKEVIVHCKTGRRSAMAVEFLQKSGFTKAKNLAGGILAWSDKVDPKVPKY